MTRARLALLYLFVFYLCSILSILCFLCKTPGKCCDSVRGIDGVFAGSVDAAVTRSEFPCGEYLHDWRLPVGPDARDPLLMAPGFRYKFFPALFNTIASLRSQSFRNVMSLKQTKNPICLALAYLCILLMMQSGDVHPNPGPVAPRFPCGVCGRAVKWGQRAVCCDECDLWYHTDCMGMCTPNYEPLLHSSCSWICCQCGLPNFSSSLFQDKSLSLSNRFDSFSSLQWSEGSPGAPIDMSSPIPQRASCKTRVHPTLRLLNVNCRSIGSKCGIFQDLVNGCDPDIVVATETWLSPGDADGGIGQAGIFSSDYRIHRRDRVTSPGGGVFVAIRNGIDGIRQVDLETDCEAVWLKITTKGAKALYVGGYYRPHVDDAHSAEELMKSLSLLSNKTASHIWLAGDFNYPGIDWDHTTLKENCPHPTLHRNFVMCLEDLALHQVVKEPTRDENILDLFITSNETLVNRARVIPGISDHDAVLIESSLYPDTKKRPGRKVPVWKKADWNGLQGHITADWDSLDLEVKRHGQVEFLWKYFRDSLERGIMHFIPHRMIKGREQYSFMSRELKRKIRKRRKLYSIKRLKPTRKNISNYNQLQSEIQKQFRMEYWNYLSEIMTPIKTDNSDTKITKNKRFYNHIKACKNDSVGVAPIRNIRSGVLETDPTTKATLLNAQFGSVFSLRTPLSLANLCESRLRSLPPERVMPEFAVSLGGVLKLLQGLNPHKAPGPDGVGPLVLRELRESIGPILHTIFTRSLESGQVPEDWRKANVVPIFKKGCKNSPVNYRPVSLTCICSKLMEHIMVSQINKHLQLNDILVSNQHGFRAQRSCETQLVEFVHDLHTNLGSKTQVDAVVMDFSKAFDKVAHNRLLFKLDRCGIQGRHLKWIESFLGSRTQVVVVDGMSSEPLPVTSGVPQGSVLGPVLFLLYINDITCNITSSIRLFADDTIIYRPIRDENDHLELQKDLTRLEKWSRDWQMEFHPSKCNIMTISRSRSPLLANYKLYGQILDRVNQMKYLGVTVASDLRWNRHVNSIVAGANTTLRFLKRNLRVSSPAVKQSAYFTFVRPKLEYASSVWDPHTLGNISVLETVQRRAARWVLGRFQNRSSVGDMLLQLGWPSLEQRRAQTRLLLLYKAINGHVMLDTFGLLRPVEGIMTGPYPHRYIALRTHTNIHAGSFFPRTIRGWNCLPAEVALAPTVEVFKRRVQGLHS